MEIFNWTTLLIILVVGVLIFLLLREVNCWYWKVNRRIELQEETNDLLKKLVSKTEKKNETNEIENIHQTEIGIEQTNVNDPKVMEEIRKKYGNKT
jgi:hypothetical protein